MQVWNVLHEARWKYRTQKSCQKSPSEHHRMTLSGYIFATKARIDNRKKSHISSTCLHNMLNFGALAAEIISLVWGTPGNFNGFRVMATLLHGTLVVGVSQTLRRWTEGATYIRQSGHHVGHWPTFLVLFIIFLFFGLSRLIKLASNQLLAHVNIPYIVPYRTVSYRIVPDRIGSYRIVSVTLVTVLWLNAYKRTVRSWFLDWASLQTTLYRRGPKGRPAPEGDVLDLEYLRLSPYVTVGHPSSCWPAMVQVVHYMYIGGLSHTPY